MKSGIFASVSSAIGFVLNAHKRYQALSLEDRCEIIDAIRSSLLENLDVITMLALKETCMGNYEDKKVKIEAAIKNTPGIEDLITEVNTGDRGMTLYELSGFGVVCCVESTTNTATAVINHVIGLISAGNAVVVCTNPIAYATTTYICNLISKAIVNSCGIDNLVVSLDENSICKTEEVMQHPDVDMIVCGAESDVLRSALSCGKKVIAEGSSDSVVLVDETADIKQAAFDISRSASFDNGLIHVSEKTCVYVKSIKDSLFSEFDKNKSYVVQSKQEILKLEQALLTDQRDLKKRWIGKSACEILKSIDVVASNDVKLIVVPVEFNHPFVLEEMRIPLLPCVEVDCYKCGLEMMIELEQRYRHTAAIHSNDINRLSEAAKVLRTAVFVKNGPALNGVGLFMPNSPFTLTIANFSGEGALSARHFTRRRKCILTNGFSIR